MVKVKLYSLKDDKKIVKDIDGREIRRAFGALSGALNTIKCVNSVLSNYSKFDEKTKKLFKNVCEDKEQRQRLVQLDKQIGYFLDCTPFIADVIRAIETAEIDDVIEHPLLKEKLTLEEVKDMDVLFGLKNKKITDTSDASNCLRSNKISTSKRNSILEELYKDSKKTRSQFVEDMRTLARKHANANASIARVIEFEKYLKNTKVPFSYSGIVWVNECKDSDPNNDIPDSTTTEQVEGVVFAHNKQMAFNEIEEKYFYANTYEDDFLIEEISVEQAKQKAAA